MRTLSGSEPRRLKGTLPEGNDELIQLVDDYLGGRRPRGLRRESDEVVRYSPRITAPVCR